MMKRFLLGVLVALLPTLARAQAIDNAYLGILNNIQSTSFTYCVEAGQRGNPYGGPALGPAPVTTAGASTTVSSVTAGTNAFANLAVGDVLVFPAKDGTTIVRAIITYTDADDVVINGANITLPAVQNFQYWKTNCGTTATSGWLDVANYADKSFTMAWEAGTADSIDWRLECKGAAPVSNPVVVYPSKGDTCGQGTQTVAQQCNIPAFGVASRITYVNAFPWSQCRIGFKAHSSAGAGNQINVDFQGRIRR